MEKGYKMHVNFWWGWKKQSSNFHKKRIAEKSLKPTLLLYATITEMNLQKFKGLPQQPKSRKANTKSMTPDVNVWQWR